MGACGLGKKIGSSFEKQNTKRLQLINYKVRRMLVEYGLCE